jgi:hypothetical protein
MVDGGDHFLEAAVVGIKFTAIYGEVHPSLLGKLE